MASLKRFDFAIVGGGLAGLTAALELSKYTRSICLIERQGFPHHKVCGEYVSNEVLPYLRSLGVDPMKAGAVSIDRFRLCNNKGKSTQTNLPLGGFGISRYTLDHLLFKAISPAVDHIEDSVQQIQRTGSGYHLDLLRNDSIEANYVIGAFGKRSNLDKPLGLSHAQRRSHWMAVKGHYQFPFPSDLVELHTFHGGYCGLSRVENGLVNACYLVNSQVFKQHGGSAEKFQANLTASGSELGRFFEQAEPMFDRPLTIAQVDFSPKRPVVNGIFMLGDSAGLIHPLCGNGMAMAIGSARIFGQCYGESNGSSDLPACYEKAWQLNYSSRLKTGRWLQRLLLSPSFGDLAMSMGQRMPGALPAIIRRTHGVPVS